MAGIRRIVVGLKSHEKSEAVTLAKFVDCIVSYFHPKDPCVQVACKLENNVLLLYPSLQENAPGKDRDFSSESNNGSMEVMLQHSPECPLWLLKETPEPDLHQSGTKLDQGVYVGVSLIVESSDEYVLMTQRSDHMRTFPRAWVPPGGHVEWNETLIEGGLRELEEETGLKLTSENSFTQLLCLWESVYPVFLGMGSPKSHHIVVYLHVKAKKSWMELQKNMKVDPEEVQGWAWLSQHNVRTISLHREGPVTINKYTVNLNGEIVVSPLELLRMFPSSLWGERKIYSGSQMALHKWLDLLQKNGTSCCSKI